MRANVCVCDIDVKALETAAKDIPGLKTVVCDVSERDDIGRDRAERAEQWLHTVYTEIEERFLRQESGRARTIAR
jgi:hypothetical protein